MCFFLICFHYSARNKENFIAFSPLWRNVNNFIARFFCRSVFILFLFSMRWLLICMYFRFAKKKSEKSSLSLFNAIKIYRGWRRINLTYLFKIFIIYIYLMKRRNLFVQGLIPCFKTTHSYHAAHVWNASRI